MSDNINLPEWFDRTKFLEPFKTKSTLELYAHFDCKNSQSFSMMMKKYFPNKPDRVPYDKYVRGLLADELDAEISHDPKLQQSTDKPSVKPEPVKQTEAKPFMSMKPAIAKEITLVEEVIKPRVRTEEDIWESKQLFKDAGRTHQNEWLRNHLDPLKETVDAPYAEDDVFTRNS